MGVILKHLESSDTKVMLNGDLLYTVMRNENGMEKKLGVRIVFLILLSEEF